MLELGADIEAKKNNNGKTGLEVAVAEGYPEMIDELLKHGAKLDNKLFFVPLSRNDYQTATKLLRYGASVDMESPSIWFALDKISKHLENSEDERKLLDETEFVRELFSRYPEVDLTGVYGRQIEGIVSKIENRSSVVMLNAISKVRFRYKSHGH